MAGYLARAFQYSISQATERHNIRYLQIHPDVNIHESASVLIYHLFYISFLCRQQCQLPRAGSDN